MATKLAYLTLINEVPAKLKRKTPAQKQAFDTYRLRERMEDNYNGSVFVTAAGQEGYRAKTRAAYNECVRLGMGIEHGL